MRLLPFAIAGALLLQPALASAEPPPLAPTATPAPPPPVGNYAPTPRYKTHSPALMGGGIALIAIGVLSVVGGATAVIIDNQEHGDFDGFITALVGLPLFVHGAGCLAGGIPMTVIGARKIPAGYAGAEPSAVPSFSVGRTTTLRWTF